MENIIQRAVSASLNFVGYEKLTENQDLVVEKYLGGEDVFFYVDRAGKCVCIILMTHT